ncbi:MAG TPA: Spy/CpxP family protein refolding chaperone [Polyangiaceae bacterium]|jgi:Spy/CpxP family protein refolding chaperone
MHPFAWWHARSGAHCGGGGGEGAGCGPHGGGGPWHGRRGGPPFGGGGGGDELGGGSFGVRRPLRFLAFKLELDEAQVTELAAILNELKTERAQAAVDDRRTTSALADVIAADSFDEAKAKGATGERVKSAERVQDAVARSLGRIHALLRPEQRGKLAYLLRTGALSM